MMDFHKDMDTLFEDIQVEIENSDRKISRKLNSTKNSIETYFTDTQTALDKCEERITRRLEDMNECRAQLKDHSFQFITRGEVAARLKLVSIGMGAVLAFVVLLKFVGK